MDHNTFLRLHEKCSLKHSFFSFVDIRDSSFLEMRAAGTVIIPWLLERLQATIGYDWLANNNPWLSLVLLDVLTNFLVDLPEEHRGKTDKLREHALNWGKRWSALTVSSDLEAPPIIGDPIIIITDTKEHT